MSRESWYAGKLSEMDVIRIVDSDDFVVDYDKSRGMYRVSIFEDGHFCDEIWFDAYEDKEVDNELNIYVKQLEDENLRLKQSNKALKNNNKVLLEGQKKLQSQIGKFKSERIRKLKEKIYDMKYESTNKGLEMCSIGLKDSATKYACESFVCEKIIRYMNELGI